MDEGKENQNFRLKNRNEGKNYYIEDINRKKLSSKKHKKVCAALNYIEHSFISDYTITECISISTFASLIGIPIGIASFF